MTKSDHDLFMLEISVIKYSKNRTRLKPLCKKIYNIRKSRINNIYDILETMSYGHIGGIYSMPDVKNAISVRKKAVDWQEMMLYGVCDALFHAISGNHAMAVKTISDLRKAQKTFEKPFLDSIEPDYKKGAAVVLASLYCVSKAIECFGEPESVKQMENAVKFVGYVRNYRMDLCVWLIQILFDNTCGEI